MRVFIGSTRSVGPTWPGAKGLTARSNLAPTADQRVHPNLGRTRSRAAQAHEPGGAMNIRALDEGWVLTIETGRGGAQSARVHATPFVTSDADRDGGDPRRP